MIKRYENFPEYAVCYLMYNDDSGLTQEDKDNINQWLIDENLDSSSLADVSEDHYFSGFPQFGLPCDCVDAIFMEHQ